MSKTIEELAKWLDDHGFEPLDEDGKTIISLLRERDDLKARAEEAEAHSNALVEALESATERAQKAEAERDALRVQLVAIREELKSAGIEQCNYPLDTFPDARSWIWIPDHDEGTATTAIVPHLAALLAEDAKGLPITVTVNNAVPPGEAWIFDQGKHLGTITGIGEDTPEATCADECPNPCGGAE